MLKRALLHVCRALGLFALSRRLLRGKLLILCYHGIAQADESDWRPKLFMRPETFRGRLARLQALGVPVVSLADGLERVRRDAPFAVVITFDDGFYNFFGLARPALQAHGFTAMVYVATYHAVHPEWPVFDLGVAYALWRQRGRAAPGALIGETEPLTSASEAERERTFDRILAYAERMGMGGTEKEALARRVAEAVGFPYEQLAERRMLCMMTPAELEKAFRDGFAVELHTHRHDIPAGRLAAEIADNRAVLRGAGAGSAAHFCYPSGRWDRSMWPTLAEAGVETATTCEPGLVDARAEPLALPRFLDAETVSDVEFEAWVSGFTPMVRALVPRVPRRTA